MTKFYIQFRGKPKGSADTPTKHRVSLEAENVTCALYELKERYEEITALRHTTSQP